MTVTATLASGPVMLYFGQEVGEPGQRRRRLRRDDGRTTIFDYWGVPEHQKWLNQGKFDGGKLGAEQKDLRDFYRRLLNLGGSSEAMRRGQFYELQDANNLGKEYNQRNLYAYLRYTGKQQVLVVVNFSADKTYQPDHHHAGRGHEGHGPEPQAALHLPRLAERRRAANALNLTLAPLSAHVFEMKPLNAARFGRQVCKFEGRAARSFQAA